MSDGEAPKGPPVDIPAMLRLRVLRANVGGSASALGSSTQLSGGSDGGSAVVAATGIAVLHGWEVLALLGCHGSTPLSAVSAAACGLLHRERGRLGELATDSWLAIPAFRPAPASAPPVPASDALAAAALVREAEALLGTPSPRDVAAASQRSSARFRATARGGEGVASSVAQRDAAFADAAAARVRNGTTASVTAKLGAAAAVALAEGAVRAAHLIEAAASSNAALDAAFSTLRRNNAAEPVVLRARLLIATPLPVYDSPEPATAAATAASSIAGGAFASRKRSREGGGGAAASDEGEGDEDEGGAPPPAEPSLSRLAPEIGAAEVTEICAPRCGLVLPLSSFLPPPLRKGPAPLLAVLRAGLCASVSLQPRWESAGLLRRLAGVCPTLVVAAPVPAEVGLSWTLSDCGGPTAAGGPPSVRLDQRHLLALHVPAAASSLHFEGVARLPPEALGGVAAAAPAAAPAGAAPGPLVLADFPADLLPALDARAAVDAALVQHPAASGGSAARALGDWAARAAAAARRAHPSAAALVALVQRPPASSADPLLPLIPLTLRCDAANAADGGAPLPLPIVVAWAHAATQLAARAAAGGSVAGELSFPRHSPPTPGAAATSSAVPALLQPVAAIRLCGSSGEGGGAGMLPLAAVACPGTDAVGGEAPAARVALTRAAARLHAAFELI